MNPPRPQNRAQELLFARFDDFLAQASHGTLAVSRFLSPGERKSAERYYHALGCADQLLFWGGYPTAERVLLYLLPDFYLPFLPEPDAEPTAPEPVSDPDFPVFPTPKDRDPASFLPDPAARAVDALLIRGSGYRVLSHRDYLGALLSLGLERDALGDLAVQDDASAVLFCSADLSPFLLAELHQVASDAVRVSPYSLSPAFTDGRRFQPIRDTVASPRLDCVVASLANLSREAAQSLIRSGSVDVDFTTELRPDFTLSPPAFLSIHGTGRFRLYPFAGETRKSRLRLVAEKFI